MGFTSSSQYIPVTHMTLTQPDPPGENTVIMNMNKERIIYLDSVISGVEEANATDIGQDGIC